MEQKEEETVSVPAKNNSSGPEISEELPDVPAETECVRVPSDSPDSDQASKVSLMTSSLEGDGRKGSEGADECPAILKETTEEVKIVRTKFGREVKPVTPVMSRDTKEIKKVGSKNKSSSFHF